ncbi:MAG: hypothetical protein ABJL67_05855 [Sulfitobacter sp.]
MIRLLAFIAALIAPVPAFALSCLAPSVERSYAQFDAAEQTYVVAHGRLTLNTARLPKVGIAGKKPPRKTLIPAKLRGTSLSKEGFKVPFEQDLTLEVLCINVWCGSAQNGEDILAFLRKDADGYALAISPCGGSAFGSPEPAMLKQVTQCMTQGNCKAER